MKGELTLPPGLGAAAAAAPAALTKDYENPTSLVEPADPPGWERIHEGSFLEAVLVTQLSGDFPGPVLAAVSVPFYSADRQRVFGAPRIESDRHGGGCHLPGSVPAGGRLPPLAVSRRPLGCPRLSWTQSSRRRSIEGPGEPALPLHVCGRRSRRGDLRPDLARQQSLCRRFGRFPGRGRARTRPGRHPDLAALSESFPHYHDSRRSPAAHLVHFRRTGSPSRRTVNHNPERRHTMRIRTWLTLFFPAPVCGRHRVCLFRHQRSVPTGLDDRQPSHPDRQPGGATGNHESAARQTDRAVHPHQGFHLGAGGSDHPTVHRSGFGARPAHRHGHVLEIRFYRRSR